jgi:hypothetical protein
MVVYPQEAIQGPSCMRTPQGIHRISSTHPDTSPLIPLQNVHRPLLDIPLNKTIPHQMHTPCTQPCAFSATSHTNNQYQPKEGRQNEDLRGEDEVWEVTFHVYQDRGRLVWFSDCERVSRAWCRMGKAEHTHGSLCPEIYVQSTEFLGKGLED